MGPRCQVAVRSALLAGVLLSGGCAEVQRGAYGIRNLDFEGVREVDGRALAHCLLTVERPHFELTLGLSAVRCGEPPFDTSAPRFALWRWPWTDYEPYNPVVLQDDLKRILRFYRARGFYDARVVEVRHDPPRAEHDDPPGPNQCDPATETCPLDLVVVVDEGEPLRIRRVEIDGLAALGRRARALVEGVPLPQSGRRFDEHDYDAAKAALGEALAEASYAGAKVTGRVELDHDTGHADIRYSVELGPTYSFGDARVQGHAQLPEASIRAAAAVPTGTPFSPEVLREIQQEVFGLGAFSAVEVEPLLDPDQGRADVLVKVTPRSADNFRLGIGVMSGALQRNEDSENQSVSHWDIHLFGRYERRHVLDTLGTLRFEDRPRLVFQRAFPKVAPPTPGNVLSLRLNQPGLVEKRTDLIFSAQWDVGPDLYLNFVRHDVLGRVALRRAFLQRVLFVTLALQQDLFYVPGQAPAPSEDGSPTSTYGYSFVEQNLVLDLRDSARQTSSGLYLGLRASQGLRWPGSDWTAFRLAPELRAFLPLPLSMVLAARLAAAAMFVVDASKRVDADSQELGPNNYRLRAGGATSNRGFVANQVGDGPTGGLRRWEASIELRARLGSDFSVVGFLDLADLSRAPRFRFRQPNPSLGFGMRYLTQVGAIRFDLGFRVGPVGADPDLIPVLEVPGAMHLTLGEAF